MNERMDTREVISLRDYEIRLIDHRSDSGEILFDDLDRIGTAVKDLVYRLTRAAADRSGRGRAPAELERLSTVRIGLLAGSTLIRFRVGDRDALPVEPFSADVDSAFWSIADAIGSNLGISVPDSVAEAAGSLALALRRAAPYVTIRVGDQVTDVIDTRHMHADVWNRSPTVPEPDAVIHGVLEMVDLRTAHFRLVDAVGNGVELDDVRDPGIACTLVGRQVTATGVLVKASGARHHRMHQPTVTAAPVAEVLLGVEPQGTLDERIRAAAASTEAEPMDLSADEFEDFMAVIRA